MSDPLQNMKQGSWQGPYNNDYARQFLNNQRMKTWKVLHERTNCGIDNANNVLKRCFLTSFASDIGIQPSDVALYVRIEALEKRNAELEQNSSGSQDMSAILDRLDALENRNTDLEETVNHLQMKCATQESEIEELRKSKIPDPFTGRPPYDEVVNVFDPNEDDSSNDDLLSVLSDESYTSSIFTQPLYEARKDHAAQSRLLNYCTQCKQGKSHKGFTSQGNYFCTSICANQFQKDKTTSKGNFTSVMNPAIYN